MFSIFTAYRLVVLLLSGQRLVPSGPHQFAESPKSIIIVAEYCELDFVGWLYGKQEHTPIKAYVEEDNVPLKMKTQKEDSYKSCMNDPKRVDNI